MPNLDYYPQYYSSDGGPWDDPCWNDDDEKELLKSGYKSIQEWNYIGRVVRKGEKGIYLSCARKLVFHKDDTDENPRLAKFFYKKQNHKDTSNLKKNYITSKENLILYLIRNGAQYIETKANIWQDGFFFQNKKAQLFILFRKSGVDVKYYDGTIGKFKVGQNIFSFESGKKCSLSYSKASVSIFYFIIQLVSVFKLNIDISSMLTASYEKNLHENSSLFF